jgi:hypothetical protein
LNTKIVQKIEEELLSFMGKGKTVTRFDFQNIVEEIVNAFTAKKKILEVTDFHVAVSKKNPDQAEVEASYNGKKQTSKATGVGPFDAIMKAMQNIIRGQKGIKVILQDFNVEIDEGGTDAVVKVTIVFTDEKNNKVVVSATSPDIIVASVNAFEKGYNLLWWKFSSDQTWRSDLLFRPNRIGS